MRRSLVLLSIIVTVGFTIAILTTLFTYPLIEMITAEELKTIIQTEEPPPETALFLHNLNEIVVQGVFWVSLAAIGFCIIALYYFSGGYQMYVAPAIISLVIFIVIQAGLFVLPEHLALGIAEPMEPILDKGLEKLQMVNYIVLGIGIILLLISQLLKPKKFPWY